MKIGIYGIKNLVNGKWYVGQSGNIEARKRSHYSELKNGVHCNEYFQFAFNKYGFDNFEFRILEETEEGLLDIQENLWIKHYKSDQRDFGYNLDTGGHQNKHHSEESKLKMSKSKKGKPNGCLGRVLSDETKRKISEKAKRRIIPAETHRRALEANKGRKMPEEHRLRLLRINLGNKYCLGKNLGNKYALGRHPSAETRKKLSEKILSVEHRRKISEALKGRPWLKKIAQ